MTKARLALIAVLASLAVPSAAAAQTTPPPMPTSQQLGAAVMAAIAAYQASAAQGSQAPATGQNPLLVQDTSQVDALKLELSRKWDELYDVRGEIALIGTQIVAIDAEAAKTPHYVPAGLRLRKERLVAELADWKLQEKEIEKEIRSLEREIAALSH
jgi:hypothetical protein